MNTGFDELVLFVFMGSGFWLRQPRNDNEN